MINLRSLSSKIMIVCGAIGVASVGLATGTTLALVAAVIVLVLVLVVMGVGRNKRGQEFPPAPPGNFLLGHLGIMTQTTTPWVTLDRIGKNYGDVMSLKLNHWCIMLNTYDAIKDAATNYLREMAGRPQNHSLVLMSDGFRDVNITSYSADWVLLRQMAGQNLRDFSGRKKLEEVAHYVLGNLQKELDKQSGQTVNVCNDVMLPAVAGILSHMCFGKDADPSVHASVKNLMGGDLYKFIVGPPRKVDLFPFLRYFNAGGTQWVKDLCARLHGLMLSELNRHKETLDPDNLRDVTDGLISAWKKATDSEPEKYAFVTDVHLYQVITNYIAGSTAGALINAYHTAALLVTYPDKQEKISQVVTKATGGERPPSLEDLEATPYLRAAVEETLRYECVSPIGVPHATTQDVTFRGYKIPARTTVLANLYDMHFGDYWKEPFDFQPERFLDDDGNFKPSDHSLPFGWGMRKCLGIVEAVQISYFILAWVTQHYKLSRVPGEEEKDLFAQDPTVAAARVMAPFNVVLEKRE